MDIWGQPCNVEVQTVQFSDLTCQPFPGSMTLSPSGMEGTAPSFLCCWLYHFAPGFAEKIWKLLVFKSQFDEN